MQNQDGIQNPMRLLTNFTSPTYVSFQRIKNLSYLHIEIFFERLNKISLLGCTFPLFPVFDGKVVGNSSSSAIFLV
jgi:hypothetical protein